MTPAEIGRRLLAWYEDEKRDLPFRGLKDPYAIWVSEIMLQQTTVATVVPRFSAFIARFPDIASLAAASEEEVLAELQGLGYYRRFRSMKRAAEVMVNEHGGVLPRDRKGLLALPGIGDYTAGAILSIAHDLPEPAVDGNVVRVITRLFELEGIHETPARKRKLGERVLEMLPEGRAGDFNQALFDLGARVCLPREPVCLMCPLRKPCRANTSGSQDRFPEIAPKRPTVERVVAVLCLEREGEILLEQRPADAARMPGFWQLPEVWAEPGEDVGALLAADLKERHGLVVELGGEIAKARHAITHHRLDCRLLGGETRGELKLTEALRFMGADEIENASDPISTISRKLLRGRARAQRSSLKSRRARAD